MRSTLAARQSPFRALRTRSSTRHPVCEKGRRDVFSNDLFSGNEQTTFDAREECLGRRELPLARAAPHTTPRGGLRMWAPRDTSAGTSRASSPGREETRVVADTRTDLLGCVDGSSVFSEAHRGLRREDENAEDWRVGGFDVFERRTSPLRRKRAPLVPGEFDHDELVRRALERARGGLVKAVGSAHLATEITPRIPLKALVPGNAGLHRGVAEHRAGLVRERSISRGLSFDDVKINDKAVTVSATVSATTEAYEPETTRTPTAERFDERHSPSVATSAWSAESNASRVELLKASSSSSRNVTGVRLFGDASSVYYPKEEGGEHATDMYPSEETLLRQREQEQHRLKQNARRRHRKRLATIVVAQWRWFARDALENLPSKMHFFWRLKRETFAVWRGVAGEAASLAALRLVAAERERRLRNTVRAFEERKQRRVSERTRKGLDPLVPSELNASRRFVAATAAAAAVRFFQWRSFVRRKSMKRAREKELSALAEARAASSRVAKKRALLRRWFHVARKKKTKRDAETRIVNASNAFFVATKRRCAFLEWRRAFRDETRKRALFIARLDRDRAFRNGLQTFLAWRDERARPAKRRREVKIRARDFFQATFVRKTWTAWRFDATPLLKKERLDKRHVWDVLDALVQSARWRLGVAAAHFAAKTDMRKKSILKLWRDVARDSANEAAAETYARTVVRKRILRAVFFHAFANPSREASFARRADAHCMQRRAAAALRAWRFTTERERSREITKKRASSFRGVRLLAKTFGAWRGPFLSRARSKRLESRKLLKALATRDALVKCRAFIGWSYRSKVVGRAKRRVVNDAVRFQRAFLTTRAFSGWVLVTEAERKADALSDAKLATCTAALQATFVGRVFDAWLEYGKTNIARRLVSALATRRFVTSVSKRALRCWKARWEQKKASRERLVVAMDHYDSKRLAFTALEAWVVFLVRRRLKRLNAAKAEALYEKRALGVFFARWIAYVEARRAKRLAIRDALDAHTMDVIKHACACWLREGLRRREERRERSLESVADDAARRTAEIWRVVFRCAEKWRSVAKRRARRSSGDKGVLSLPVVNRNAFAERAEVRFPAASAAVPFAPRRRPPPRRLDGDDARGDAPRRDAGGAPPVPGKPPRAPLFPLGAPLSSRRSSSVSADGSRDASTTNEASGDASETSQEDVLSPSSLDAHERCICEFEALKAESKRVQNELKRLDASVADGAVATSVASVRRVALATASKLAREKRALLLPAVRLAAAALGEYRSDMATSVASGW